MSQANAHHFSPSGTFMGVKTPHLFIEKGHSKINTAFIEALIAKSESAIKALTAIIVSRASLSLNNPSMFFAQRNTWRLDRATMTGAASIWNWVEMMTEENIGLLQKIAEKASENSKVVSYKVPEGLSFDVYAGYHGDNAALLSAQQPNTMSLSNMSDLALRSIKEGEEPDFLLLRAMLALSLSRYYETDNVVSYINPISDSSVMKKHGSYINECVVAFLDMAGGVKSNEDAFIATIGMAVGEVAQIVSECMRADHSNAFAQVVPRKLRFIDADALTVQERANYRVHSENGGMTASREVDGVLEIAMQSTTLQSLTNAEPGTAEHHTSMHPQDPHAGYVTDSASTGYLRTGM